MLGKTIKILNTLYSYVHYTSPAIYKTNFNPQASEALNIYSLHNAHHSNHNFLIELTSLIHNFDISLLSKAISNLESAISKT